MEVEAKVAQRFFCVGLCRFELSGGFWSSSSIYKKSFLWILEKNFFYFMYKLGVQCVS